MHTDQTSAPPSHLCASVPHLWLTTPQRLASVAIQPTRFPDAAAHDTVPVAMVLLVWLYWVLLLAVDLGGVLLAAFTLPGTWLILGATATYALVTHARHIVGWKSLVVLLGLTVLAEVGEFVLGGAGAKKAGANKWGMFGGLVGAILGGIFLSAFIPFIFPLSTIAGICLGSFLGAFAVELVLGRPVGQSVRIGFGAAKGRFLGIVAKVSIAIAMFLLSVGVAFPRGHARTPASATPPLVTRPVTRPATRPATTGLSAGVGRPSRLSPAGPTATLAG